MLPAHGRGTTKFPTVYPGNQLYLTGTRQPQLIRSRGSGTKVSPPNFGQTSMRPPIRKILRRIVIEKELQP